MKAVRVHESGGVSKFLYEDAPDPAISPTGVLVRVKAAALNHLEAWAAKMPPGVTFPAPRILGSDAAGVVEAVGDAVSGVEVGVPVMLQPGVSCGRCQACLTGQDNLCRSFGLLGQAVNGGLAEIIAVPAVNLIPKPDNLSFGEAASIPLVFLTAWHMLAERAKVRQGETVLVNAAGSGVGVAAVQIAKMLGARVIASAGSDAKLAKARKLGADDLINYTTSDLADEALKLTDGRGVDLVFENVGAAVFEGSVRALATNGRIVTCGATAGNKATLDLTSLFLRHHSIIGSTMGTKGELLRLGSFFASGRLKPVVDRVYPLSEIRAALQRMLDREQFGKIVLTP